MAKVSLRAYNREIETMIDRGHLDEAIANCRHILKTFPKHIETYRLLGKAYLEYKRYPEAVDIFSRVLAAVPDDFVANVGMSIIRDEENKLDDAIWHMERAFETQPSNAAIQSELQRLYGRRDGIQPPRIRMTRGALAHMYVQGELYPQAISEIKSVLKEDAGRIEMRALLARACYRSGLKNEAADVASSVLRSYPYCLDANRVLMEILSSDRSESAQVYRQRVVELDPYAAHVTDTVFQSNEVPEAAVNIERLDWNGQPVNLQADWGTTEAISLDEDKAQDEQPDWLKSVFEEPPAQASEPLGSPEDQPAIVPPFDLSAPSAPTAEPAEDIPDFLRTAGWGQSTGAFDESKPASTYEEPDTEPPIAKGELPDWVKAMAPVEAQESPEEEEQLPDWIDKIGTGVPSDTSDSDNQLDWIRQLDQPAQAQPSDDQPDWLKQLDQPEQTIPLASDDQPDWLKGMESQSESAPVSTPTEQPEKISQLDQPSQAQSESQSSDDQLDWLKDLDRPEQPIPAETDEQPDWLKGFGSESESSATEEPDWLQQIGEQTESKQAEPSSTDLNFSAETDEQAEPAAVPASTEADFLDQTVEQPAESVSRSGDSDIAGEVTEEPREVFPSEPLSSTMDTDSLGTSEQERDDSFAWLEGLAAKQGASEGLLTTPEERMEEEPDWVKRARGLTTDQSPTQESDAQPAEKIEELGKSEQERDDSFAWLESLAAKQGASEGLLTTPDERMEEEPDWVKRAREVGTAAEQPPTPPPATAAEEPSSTDDTAAWLRSLDEEETASPSSTEADATGIWLKSLDEGLVEIQRKEPAERPEPELPAWMEDTEEEQLAEATAPSVPVEDSAEEVQAAQAPEQLEPEIPAWSQTINESEHPAEASALSPSVEGATTEQSAEQPGPETPAWAQSDEEKTGQAEPVTFSSDIRAGTSEIEAQQPAQMDDLPEWMQFIEDKAPAEDSTPITSEQTMAAEDSEWIGSIDEPVASSESLDRAEEKPAADSQDIPAWLNSLDEEETQAVTPTASDADLPAWLRGEEAAAPEPSELEATRVSDWQPVEEKQPEPEPVSDARSESFEETQEQPEPAEPSPEREEAAISVSEPASELQKEPAAPIEAAMANMPVDPILGRAREDFSNGDIPRALNTYEKLIRKARLLDEVIYDLREALYRFPVDVGIWQALGDAYMRANRLQDALDAYTKAEELLR
ncbi:MAG TPA: tetratricopeptide repeat protein [Anaerolineales bacterium]